MSSETAAITYPPELLPSPDEGDEAEVIVIDPDTRKARVIYPLGSEKAQPRQPPTGGEK